MKHNGALLCLVIGLAVAKAFSISGSVSVSRPGASAPSSLTFPRISGFNVPFANLFGLRTTTRASTTTKSNTSRTTSGLTTPSSVTSSSTNSGSSSATTQSSTGGSSSSTTQSSNTGTTSGATQSSNGGSSSSTTQSSNSDTSSATTQSSNSGSSSSAAQSSNSDTSSGTTQSSDVNRSSDGGSSSSTTETSNGGSSSDTTESSNGGSSNSTAQPSNSDTSSGTTQSSNAPATNENSSTTSSISNNVTSKPASARTSGLLSLFNIPSAASLIPDLSSNGSSSNMEIPTIPGLDTIAAMASGPAVSTALKEAEDHMAEALSISGNITIGLDQAVEDALASDDPAAALGDIAQAIIDSYLAVAANCPFIVVGARVLQEGIRLAFEVVQSAQNVIFGTT